MNTALNNQVEFEPLWQKCLIAIGKAYQALRARAKDGNWQTFSSTYVYVTRRLKLYIPNAPVEWMCVLYLSVLHTSCYKFSIGLQSDDSGGVCHCAVPRTHCCSGESHCLTAWDAFRLTNAVKPALMMGKRPSLSKWWISCISQYILEKHHSTGALYGNYECLDLWKLFLSTPCSGCNNMSSATQAFSPGWSKWTWCGSPYCLVPSLKHWNTTSARLLSEHFGYVMRQLYPSIQPWITKFHLYQNIALQHITSLHWLPLDRALALYICCDTYD